MAVKLSTPLPHSTLKLTEAFEAEQNKQLDVTLQLEKKVASPTTAGNIQRQVGKS